MYIEKKILKDNEDDLNEMVLFLLKWGKILILNFLTHIEINLMKGIVLFLPK